MRAALALDNPNLTERAVSALSARIDSGEFAPGRKLPSESELVASYGVSRTVVREAISQLRARGLVETRRGIGSFARRPPAGATPFPVVKVDGATLQEVLALFELRIGLETEAAALAATHRNDDELARMTALVDTIAGEADEGDDAVDADFEFHLCVAKASRNHYFADLLQHLGRAIIPHTRIDSAAVARRERPDYIQQVNQEHRDVIRAIACGDSDAASAAMRTHLANSRERLRALRTTDADH